MYLAMLEKVDAVLVATLKRLTTFDVSFPFYLSLLLPFFFFFFPFYAFLLYSIVASRKKATMYLTDFYFIYFIVKYEKKSLVRFQSRVSRNVDDASKMVER